MFCQLNEGKVLTLPIGENYYNSIVIGVKCLVLNKYSDQMLQ